MSKKPRRLRIRHICPICGSAFKNENVKIIYRKCSDCTTRSMFMKESIYGNFNDIMVTEDMLGLENE